MTATGSLVVSTGNCRPESRRTFSRTPLPTSVQGLAFGPPSVPNADPNAISLYLADAGLDNIEDGRVYEASVDGAGAGPQNQASQVDAGNDITTLIPNPVQDAVNQAAEDQTPRIACAGRSSIGPKFCTL